MTVSPTTQTNASSKRGSGSLDHRGSPIPNGAMISTRLMELRKRRGLMVALIVVFIGLPTIFLAIRLILHATDPHSYSAAGGYGIFNNVVDGVLFIFGFIVAATLGCFAGSVDLTEGVFRHLVVTGRSRVALYLARIPAGLAILVPLVAVGFTILCAVCVFAAPPKTNYNGVNVPAGLSRTAFVQWAENDYNHVLCAFPSRNIPYNFPCTSTGIPSGRNLPPGAKLPPKAHLQELAAKVADQNYVAYKDTFRVPPVSLMIETGLWIELEATLGFVIGLGLSSLMGQRTVPVVILIVFELILTPLLANHTIPHLINAQRGLVGVAMARIQPSSLTPVFGGQNGPGGMRGLPISLTASVCVIVAWIVGWTALGAWRMARRDV
ncbi:MAG: hypothetical protein WA860_01635 [Acidimicrobiales bacterium]